jgi:hypothetical protein
MAWTSLVDTATKATSHGVENANDPNNVYVDRSSVHNVSPSAHNVSPSSIHSSSQQENTGVAQLSPEALETEVTYFTGTKGHNEDLSDDENDKTIMDEVRKNKRLHTCKSV